MINLRNSPFLWISLMLLISFWINKIFPVNIPGWVFGILISLSLACALLASTRFNPGNQYLSTLLIGGLIFSSGTIRIQQFKNNLYGDTIIHQSVNRQGIFKVNQVLKNKGASVSLKCERITIFENTEEDSLPCQDKYLLIYVRTNEAIHFFPGDIIRAEGWLSEIKGPLNPNAFDARRYYNTIGIRHQLYCKREDVSTISPGRFSIVRMTARWQTTLSNIVRANTSVQVAQLTNALVWGDRSDMDTEVRDAFAESGAMHVLSVSGMHVAIIYSMLFFILGAPGAGPFIHRAIRFCCYALAIVLYMGLTGACPAVVRAGLMIILFLLGKSMGWNTQIWNLLGFAAFLMLWINPFVWENLGFQLSFLAMAGILLFAKPIIRYFSFRKKIFQMCWDITALSISAQVFILPILLGQFHQFPLTFIMSSIAAVPAAYLVMLEALLNIILSFIRIDFLWHALEWTGKIFISMMKWMSSLNPLMHFSLPSAGSLSLMLMAIIFSTALVFKFPQGKIISWALAILTIITLGCHRIREWSTTDLVIYHSSKGLLIDVFDQGYCYSILDCSLVPASIEFATRGYRCKRDVINVRNSCKEYNSGNNRFDFQSSQLAISPYSFLFWHDNVDKECAVPTHLVIDECNDSNSLFEYILSSKEIIIIIPAHLQRNFRKELANWLIEHSISFHDIDEDGYFKIEI